MTHVSYLRPLRSLLESIEVKIAVSFIGALASWVIKIYAELVTAEPYLAVGVVTLWAMDFISGVTRSSVEKGRLDITHYGIRQSLVKLIEYSLFILSLDVLLGMAQHASEIGVVKVGSAHAIDGAYFIVGVTEFRSVQENIRKISLSDLKELVKGQVRLFTNEGSSND